MKKAAYFIAGLWSLFGGALGAQTPEQPLLPEVAPFAHWRVDYTYRPRKKATEAEPEAPDTGARLAAVEYLLTGRTARITKYYSDSSRLVSYWKDHYEVTQTLPNREIRLKEHPGAGAKRGLLAQYPGLEWVDAAHFAGLEKIPGGQGEKGFLFRKTQTLAQELNVTADTLTKNPEVTWVLWTALETGLPVLFAAAEIVQRYTFFPTPAQAVELPPEYQAVFAPVAGPLRPPGLDAGKAR